eukprot:SAG11_NODE_1447_length_4888_cov_2.819795_1_plen_407_part_00
MAQHFYLAERADAHHVYVGAADPDGRSAIYKLHFAGGRLQWPDPLLVSAAEASFHGPAAVVTEAGAGWIALSPSGRNLYLSVREGAEPEHNYIGCYSINPFTGELTAAGKQQTVLPGSPHASVDPSGRMLVSSQMAGGGITSFPIDADGVLQPAASVIQLQGGGSGANLRRSTQNFAHSAQMAVGGKHVLVPDLGADKLWCYALDSAAGTVSLASCWIAPPGSGPRHLAAHPNGKWCYLITEMGCTVEALAFDSETGGLARIAPSISTLPADWSGTMSVEAGDSTGCTTADIHTSPDGRFVYGSNRVNGGEGNIVILAVDETSGALSLVGHVGTGGVTPRNFALHPSGDWLIVANQDSGNLVTMRVDKSSGMLTPCASAIEGLRTPLCIQFVPVPVDVDCLGCKCM